jgi:hypothetical protein
MQDFLWNFLTSTYYGNIVGTFGLFLSGWAVWAASGAKRAAQDAAKIITRQHMMIDVVKLCATCDLGEDPTISYGNIYKKYSNINIGIGNIKGSCSKDQDYEDDFKETLAEVENNLNAIQSQLGLIPKKSKNNPDENHYYYDFLPLFAILGKNLSILQGIVEKKLNKNL